MTDPRHRLGYDAEAAAARWLEAAGWRVLARRYRSAVGAEVDLILLDPQRVLVAVEVRARRSNRAGAPEETVDVRRAHRIGRTLAAFAAGTNLRYTGLRVDLVAVRPLPDGRRYALRRIPDIGG